ncbi:PLP-dependent aminotransferase family protein [Flavobacterium chuncheonense]|uniref:PLP-dependent aminotransferase family protein n=1 Tax=Flavobacterium chuncheonense TaxID=2026653 RepID=A0ABW5YMU5_9FLAO
MKDVDSPVVLVLKNIIQYQKNTENAVYIQISQQIINAIQRGIIDKGAVLPGTRILSQSLKIHRNTAVAVYEELASQGWVEIIPNKGTYVLFPKPKTANIKAIHGNIDLVNEYAKTTGFTFQTSFHLAPIDEPNTASLSINDGQPDLRLHPVHQFSKWYSASMKKKNLIAKWNKTNSYSNFEVQLANYLNATRGFKINPNNIMNTRSTEMSLYIISQLLLKRDDIVLVGDLSNYAANMIFQQVGSKIKTIKSDEFGLNVEQIEKFCKKEKIRCVYVSPNRDYPTTYALSPKRRLHLLKLAKQYKFAIIEDDFDYDFQFEGTSKLPLACSDTNGQVIYLGKLGQSLFPSFQTGFVVAPENLIVEAKNYLQILDKQGDLIQEQMLSELIYEGEIHRLIKKNILIYQKRLDYLCHLLDQYFKGIITYRKPNGGLAIWLEFAHKISLIKLAKEAANLNLHLPQKILYQNKNICAIRFGYGQLNENDLEIALQKLKEAYTKILQ